MINVIKKDSKEEQAWNDGLTCPCCGATKVYYLGRFPVGTFIPKDSFFFECAECQSEYSTGPFPHKEFPYAV